VLDGVLTPLSFFWCASSSVLYRIISTESVGKLTVGSLPNLSQLDRSIVLELPLEIRKELAQAYKRKQTCFKGQKKGGFVLPSSRSSALSVEKSRCVSRKASVPNCADYLPSFSQIDRSVFDTLPGSMQRELMREIDERYSRHSKRPRGDSRALQCSSRAQSVNSPSPPPSRISSRKHQLQTLPCCSTELDHRASDKDVDVILRQVGEDVVGCPSPSPRDLRSFVERVSSSLRTMIVRRRLDCAFSVLRCLRRHAAIHGAWKRGFNEILQCFQSQLSEQSMNMASIGVPPLY